MSTDPNMPEPVAFIDSLQRGRPDCVTDLKYCSVLQHERGDHLKYTPVVTTDAAQAYAEALAAKRVAQERDPHRGGSSYEASMLRNLLARIHGDGGHYVEQHGLEKALEDADTMVASWRAAPDVARAVAQERERCAKLRSLLQGAEILFAPLCRDCTGWNWLDETRAALAKIEVPEMRTTQPPETGKEPT